MTCSTHPTISFRHSHCPSKFVNDLFIGFWSGHNLSPLYCWSPCSSDLRTLSSNFPRWDDKKLAPRDRHLVLTSACLNMICFLFSSVILDESSIALPTTVLIVCSQACTSTSSPVSLHQTTGSWSAILCWPQARLLISCSRSLSTTYSLIPAEIEN